ncbi:hypothetical protein ACP4OV_010374 [Aristida adscensionis]
MAGGSNRLVLVAASLVVAMVAAASFAAVVTAAACDPETAQELAQNCADTVAAYHARDSLCCDAVEEHPECRCQVSRAFAHDHNVDFTYNMACFKGMEDCSA